ncbi:hypothetical protein COU56_02930 [Candidatus Pacearchaeota archaeon CG10_big_fil_rev_8_21_14_0_10_31_9]|nr:MAG: hypothetical protein AUJ62_01870 [Candidatus Pacearchaeota archaeon CG1_02_32_21]PIN94222.1 MAG: hypothetical protein COU56_02930 [Candidatus Pacearchaeota archaeon CG10_big_fil_rev_8_21_14_0_10_31_9]PIZ82995.1 MAG: hypothetical protein COX97_02045 [Candidatus Pacearchaeota archaeon CG_4_10_14_0_2_um_filter_05_32_18]
MVFDKLKKSFALGSQGAGDYVEIDLGQDKKESKVSVRPFVLKKFEDVNDILASLREGYTIAVIDIQTLRKKDVIELKRAISKIKKTTEALEGNITGFGENIVIATPAFAQIHIPGSQQPSQGQQNAPQDSRKFEAY